MCGIYGIVSRGQAGPELPARLSEMGAAQRHRGPDDRRETLFAEGHLGLGLVRLSILDLVTGMQPIACPEDGSAIVCNGQIYNYLELKSSLTGEAFVSRGDIEVALRLYRRHGTGFLELLNGMYAGAIYSPPEKRLLLFRDRFGIKPLYYTVCGDDFYFASEIKPLLAGTRRPARLNREGLPLYFSCRYLPGEETMFQGIYRLPPGSYLDYDLDRGRFSIKRYWEYRLDRIDHDLTLDRAADRYLELLADAVRIRMRSDVEVGALISGGIDSTVVSALAVGHKPDLRLFTIAFEEEKYDESPRVQRFLADNSEKFRHSSLETAVCRRSALAQLPEIVRALEEPISLGTVLPTDQVCEMAGRRLKVVLTGEGADEIFAGYRKFLIEYAAEEYPGLAPSEQRELDRIYPELAGYLAVRDSDPVDRYIQSELLFAPAEISRLLGREAAPVRFPDSARPVLTGREHPLNAAIAMETRARLPDYVILRLDKLSMRHSLETRTPFLDFRLAELAAAMPVSFKADYRNSREKMICRHALTRGGIVDAKTGDQPKQPFTIPLTDWLAEPSTLPEVIREVLEGDLVRRQGILDPGMVKEEQQRPAASDIGPHTLVSPADRLWSMIMFTVWYNEFFD